MQLLINMLLYWPDCENKPMKERILWVDPKQDIIVVIDVENLKAMPIYRSSKDIQEAIEQESIKVLSEVPLNHDKSITWLDERGLNKIHKEHRDRAWEIIQPLVTGNPPPALIEKGRGTLIVERAKEIGCSKVSIYSYLRKYWQRGLVKNALLPDFHLCGAPGKEKKPGEKKRGNTKEKSTGVNVTTQDRAIFASAYKKFHTDDKLSLPKTYDKMLETYYITPNYKTVMGYTSPILQKKDEVPSLVRLSIKK